MLQELFVISYHIFEGEPPKFCFVLSTKHLLKSTAYFEKKIHADATNKLVWQDFSVLVVVTTDKERKFYFICPGVFTSECQENFLILFIGLKENVFIFIHILCNRQY